MNTRMRNSFVERLRWNGTVLLLAGFTLFTGCAPEVRSFSPSHGPGGTVVTIKGVRFGETIAENIIEFQGVAVPTSDILSASPTEIKAKVPAGARTGLIRVSTVKGSGTSQENFIVDDGTAEWSLMVYLDADNNLEMAGIGDFFEMASVAPSKKVNIIVQMDRTPGFTSEHGNWTDTRRFVITKGSTPSMAPVQNLGEQNMGDPAVLRDFVEWAVTNYPAKHYALSIWNHGDGWRMLREGLAVRALRAPATEVTEQAVTRAIATDDTDNDLLYMREVQTALEGAKARLEERLGTQVKLDVVGFDACLMGMVEVAYTCRNVADYVVASEELEPGNGWPYDTILSDLVVSPSMTPAQFATLIVDKYGAAYTSNVTQAAADVSKLTALAGKIDNFTTQANTEWATLKTARLNSRQYHPSWSTSCWGVDLWDFADEVDQRVASIPLRTAATELKNAVDAFIIREHHSPNREGSHGTCIYFPPTQAAFNNDPDHTGYEQSNTFMPVDFVHQHEWSTWLADYYANNP